MSEQHWSKSQQWIEWLNAGVLSVAQDRGYIAPNKTLQDKDAAGIVDDLLVSFVGRGKGMIDFATPQEFAAEFKKWLPRERKEPKPGTAQYIQASITKHFGGVDIQFTYGAQFDVENDSDRFAAFEFVVHAIEQQFEQYGEKLPTMKAPTASGSARETVSFTGDSILKESKDGAAYFKIKGGEYKKFGVRVWPEVLKRAGINGDLLTFGEHPLGRECVAEVRDGKITKVTSIS